MLTRRKHETGLNVQDIGNLILRGMLDRPLIPELIGRRLVESGMVTEEQYTQLLEDALADVAASVHPVDSTVRHTSHSTLVSGSWEMRELYLADDGSFQVIGAWAKDRRSRPFPAHCHEGDEFFVVLSGKLLVTQDSDTIIVPSPGVHHVPRGMAHSTTPIEDETSVIVVLSPPEQAYRTEGVDGIRHDQR